MGKFYKSNQKAWERVNDVVTGWYVKSSEWIVAATNQATQLVNSTKQQCH